MISVSNKCCSIILNNILKIQLVLQLITYETTNLFLYIFTPVMANINEFINLLHAQTSKFHPNSLKNCALIFDKVSNR